MSGLNSSSVSLYLRGPLPFPLAFSGSLYSSNYITLLLGLRNEENTEIHKYETGYRDNKETVNRIHYGKLYKIIRFSLSAFQN